MARTPGSISKWLLLAGASALACGGLAIAGARADQPSTAQTNAAVGQAAAAQSESVIVRAQKRLLKEKNSPSAVTELGAKQISAVGVAGSTGQLLRQAPSVNVYQQGLGDNAPELTIRGVRGLEVATTLDGVPTQDLLAPGNFYLSNNIGGVFTTSQISGVSIYPGVAYPDKNTFGTIGGTIAYSSKRPTDNYYFDVTGSVGSFGTFREGFELSSGAIDSPLGTGDNAAKVLLSYNNFQTQGFIDGTPNRENEMLFAFDKPYNDGLSKFQVTVIYNTANGLIENEPVPLPYLNKNGLFSNYPTNLDFASESNDFLTIMLKDDTYINDYVTVGATAFYLGNDQQSENYGNINLFTPSITQSPLYVGGSTPFINNPAGFGEAVYYGMPRNGGFAAGGTGGLFYGAPYNLYDGLTKYPPGSKYCPQSLVNKYLNSPIFGQVGFTPCGLNDQITGLHTDTYGIQPRAVITPPDIYGLVNTIKIGALVAKETAPISAVSPTLSQYFFLGGAPQTPTTTDNEFGIQSGGVEREIYQFYMQDKVDALDNTLHVTPGLTIEGTHSSVVGDDIFGGHGGLDGSPYGAYKATKWDREYLPFVNVTYDFDKIVPALRGLSAYGSYGTSALYAPVSDFGPNTVGPPPYASIVHMYEGGVKYNVSNLLLSADYFYQKVDRDFGFFTYESGPLNGLSLYDSDGQREFKGVEAAATWQVLPNFQLFGNVSHLLAKYLTSDFAFVTVADDQYGIGLKGEPISGIPDWLSTFGADYSRKAVLMDGDVFDIRLTGQYTGHQNTTMDLDGTAYTNPAYNFQALAPLNYAGCPGVPGTSGSCLAYTRYNQLTGATTHDPNGGISPFAVFDLDLNYTLPTPQLPVLKRVVFDLNIQNLFDQRYFQYFYRQISPTGCGTFKSGPFVGLGINNYGCTPEFADAIPGQPFSVFFTVTARF